MTITTTTFNPWDNTEDDGITRWHFTGEDAKAVLQEFIDGTTVSVLTFEGRGAEGDLEGIRNNTYGEAFVIVNEGDQLTHLDMRKVSNVWIATDEELPEDVVEWIKATIAADKISGERFTVWVNGSSHDGYLSKAKATELAQEFIDGGYELVTVRNESFSSVS